MAESNGWGELISDLAVLESEADDDSEFEDEEDIGDEDDVDDFDIEAVRRRGSRRNVFARRRAPHRARPGRNYGRQVKGRDKGVVRTPNGPAQIELPGKFPTVDEFQKTVNEIQNDMKANSIGIKELADQQKKDVVRLADMVTTSEKKLRKQMKRTQVVSAMFALAPLAINVISEFKKQP
jgi:hypothetical protein